MGLKLKLLFFLSLCTFLLPHLPEIRLKSSCPTQETILLLQLSIERPCYTSWALRKYNLKAMRGIENPDNADPLFYCYMPPCFRTGAFQHLLLFHCGSSIIILWKAKQSSKAIPYLAITSGVKGCYICPFQCNDNANFDFSALELRSFVSMNHERIWIFITKHGQLKNPLCYI